jgi:hypothetical protein
LAVFSPLPCAFSPSSVGFLLLYITAAPTLSNWITTGCRRREVARANERQEGILKERKKATTTKIRLRLVCSPKHTLPNTRWLPLSFPVTLAYCTALDILAARRPRTLPPCKSFSTPELRDPMRRAGRHRAFGSPPLSNQLS